MVVKSYEFTIIDINLSFFYDSFLKKFASYYNFSNIDFFGIKIMLSSTKNLEILLFL